MLECRWQRQALAEVLLGLVGREAWTQRRNLEQDAIRLAEVDGAEVEALDHRRRFSPALDDAVAPRDVVFLGRSPGHGVHGAGSAEPAGPRGLVRPIKVPARLPPR